MPGLDVLAAAIAAALALVVVVGRVGRIDGRGVGGWGDGEHGMQRGGGHKDAPAEAQGGSPSPDTATHPSPPQRHPRPLRPDPRARARWDQAALTIGEHRLRWNITDPHRALGDRPADPLQLDERRARARAIERYQRELTCETRREHSRARGLSR